MTPLAARTLDAIDRHALLRDGRRVLVALSGGADSVSLLFLLRELETAGHLTLAGVGHLNHQLRVAADADEAFCAALAARLALPFRSTRVDVAALARETRRSIEDAARDARYTFLAAAAAELDADAVAVAHTRDDQAETFLLRLVRGAGARGLGGIRPRVPLPTVASTEAPEARRWIVRPLLDIRRDDLRACLRDREEGFREDASNADVTIPRNRVRHELLPYLERHFSPAIVDVLARAASLAQQDECYLQDAVASLASAVLATDAGSIVLDADMLAGSPPALATRVAQTALERLASGRAVSFDHIQRLLALAAQPDGASLSLPGQTAVRAGRAITLRSSVAVPRPPSPVPGPRSLVPGPRSPNSFAFSLSIPGEVQLGPQGLTVCAEKLSGPDARQRQWKARESEVGIAQDAVELPLAVRSRRPGDRFHPLGAPGTRKLQDFLVDRKVPRRERDTLPLVVDANDRIVWVAGQSVAEDFRVTDPSRGVLLLKVKRLGGPG